MSTWRGALPPPYPEHGWTDRAGAILRGVTIAGLLFGGLVVLLLLRLIERPLFKRQRPVTPLITQGVCRGTLRVMGVTRIVSGTPMRGQGAMVANHSSWLDIFALNACTPIYFVSKSEVAGWPGIGWLARATGTVFIRRDPLNAAAQRQMLVDRLRAGHRLLFFPEGTSTDGFRVLPFKTTLFAAFFTEDLKARTAVQPVSVSYRAPDGTDPAFYGWWGDMEFGRHLWKVLAARHNGTVSITFHRPLTVSDAADRKSLARAAESVTRGELPSG